MAFDYKNTFWYSKAPLSKEYDRLWAELVPPTGSCQTVEGELLRAICQIYHDYYNNGFGNNWSGAYNYLDKHFGLKAGERKLLKPYSKGRRCASVRHDVEDPIAPLMEELVERVVKHLLEAEKDGWEPNSEDMLALAETSRH